MMPSEIPSAPLTTPASAKLVPILNWLPQYDLALLQFDVLAGVTLAAYAIPVSLAYASLAGLPPPSDRARR